MEIYKIKKCPSCGVGIHDQRVTDSGHVYTVFACFSRHWHFYGFTDKPDEFKQSMSCMTRCLTKEVNVFEGFYLKIKLEDPDAKMPTRATKGDAGLDIYSPKDYVIEPREDVLIPSGWKCEFPIGFVMVIKEKGGRATKDHLDIGACVVDAGYRGIVHVHFFNNSNERVIIKQGEKIAQAVIYPCWTGQPIQVTNLTESERGEGAFGSTGLK